MEVSTLTSNGKFNFQPQSDDGPFIPVTVEMYERFLFVVKVIIIPALCILGMVGNGVGLVVLRQDSRLHSHNFHVYMCGLMLSHMAASVTNLLFGIPNIINIYDYYMANFLLQNMRPIAIYLTKLFDNFAACILLMMSAERLMSLLQPLTFRNTWVLKFSRIILLVGFLLISVVLLPFPLCCSPLKFVNSENKTEYRFAERSLFWKDFMNQFVFIASIVQYFIFPLCILFVNCGIPIAFYRYNKLCIVTIHADVQRSQQQSKLTILVVCIVVLYLVMSIPNMFGLTLDFFNDEYSFSGRYAHIFYFFGCITTVLTHLNYACDCMIYIFSIRRFRRRIQELCCKHCISLSSATQGTSMTIKHTGISTVSGISSDNLSTNK